MYIVYRIYVDIMTGGKLLIIQVANMDITYWSVRLSSRRVGEGLKGVDGDVILDSFEFHFIRILDNRL